MVPKMWPLVSWKSCHNFAIYLQTFEILLLQDSTVNFWDVTEPAKSKSVGLGFCVKNTLNSDLFRDHGRAILYKLQGRTQPSALAALRLNPRPLPAVYIT